MMGICRWIGDPQGNGDHRLPVFETLFPETMAQERNAANANENENEEDDDEEFDADLFTDGEQSHQIEQQECVRNNSLLQLTRAPGGMSGQQQQERMHVTERQ